jgi:hypothetical protein
MNDSSIEGRVEMLRREIAMIQQAELNYRGHRNHSLEDKAEHDKPGCLRCPRNGLIMA